MKIQGAFTIAAVLAGCLALPTLGQAASEQHGPTSPEKFMKEAASGGMAEVRLGKLAQERAENEDVKNFGKRMADDHSNANQELKELAAQKKVALPKDIDAKQKALEDRLSKLKGKQFDKAYMDAMLEDHKHDVAAFQAAAKSSDPDVQAFASKTLPTLEAHLKDAERIAGMSGSRTAR